MVALALSFASAALFLRLALAFLSRVAIAIPNERSSHECPTPQVGGIIIIPIFLLTLLAGMWASIAVAPFDLVAMCAVFALCVIGFLDDRSSLAVLARLLLFILIVGSVLFWSSTLSPQNAIGYEWISIIFFGFVLLSFINITNFMDGMDGLIVVEFVPVLLLLASFAYLGEITSIAPLVPTTLLGFLAAFAMFNWPPARLFLGDAGSLPLGFLIAYFLIQFGIEKNPISAVLPVLYFIIDASLTLARRVWRGEKFWRAHREHFYQRALDAGQGVKSILARVFFCNIGLCMLSYLALGGSWQTMLACLSAGSMLVFSLLLSLASRRFTL